MGGGGGEGGEGERKGEEEEQQQQWDELAVNSQKVAAARQPGHRGTYSEANGPASVHHGSEGHYSEEM